MHCFAGASKCVTLTVINNICYESVLQADKCRYTYLLQRDGTVRLAGSSVLRLQQTKFRLCLFVCELLHRKYNLICQFEVLMAVPMKNGREVCVDQTVWCHTAQGDVHNLTLWCCN